MCYWREIVRISGQLQSNFIRNSHVRFPPMKSDSILRNNLFIVGQFQSPLSFSLATAPRGDFAFHEKALASAGYNCRR